jgi:hypothetical protein
MRVFVLFPMLQPSVPNSLSAGDSPDKGPVRRMRSAKVTHEIPNKSILLAQVEASFTNFNYMDLVHQYTTMGFEVRLSPLLSYCSLIPHLMLAVHSLSSSSPLYASVYLSLSLPPSLSNSVGGHPLGVRSHGSDGSGGQVPGRSIPQRLHLQEHAGLRLAELAGGRS